jgi:hypothetical protein
MFEPGYYKVNYRALRLGELRHSVGWFLGIPLWLAFRFMPVSRGGIWMPVLWDEGKCNPEDLSEDFWQATRQHRADFEKLGFIQYRLVKPPKPLDPIVRDYGAIFYLDPKRSYFGSLVYIRVFEAFRSPPYTKTKHFPASTARSRSIRGIRAGSFRLNRRMC